jgi:hypothetical protein
MLGAIGANDFPHSANGSGRANSDHASSRTSPDSAERLTGIYGSDGWVRVRQSVWARLAAVIAAGAMIALRVAAQALAVRT